MADGGFKGFQGTNLNHNIVNLLKVAKVFKGSYFDMPVYLTSFQLK